MENAQELWVQLNRKKEFESDISDPKDKIIYAKAFMPSQFEQTMQFANTLRSFAPVAVWKIKYKGINNF